jgi:LysR family hca operon transcriptional activator
VEDPDIASEVVLSDEIVAILPAEHPLAAKERIALAELVALPLVYLKKTMAAELHDVAVSLAAQAGVEFRSRVETENILTTLSAVGVGLGCSLVPKYLEQILPKTAVSRSLDLIPAPRVDLVVAYRKQCEEPILGLFLSLVRECFRLEQEDSPEKPLQ